MEDLRPAAQAEEQEGNPQAVELGTGILGRIQGCCPVV